MDKEIPRPDFSSLESALIRVQRINIIKEERDKLIEKERLHVLEREITILKSCKTVRAVSTQSVAGISSVRTNLFKEDKLYELSDASNKRSAVKEPVGHINKKPVIKPEKLNLYYKKSL